jgi:Thioredoxin
MTAPAILAPPIVSTVDPRTMQERFSAGQTFPDFLAHAVANADLWRGVYARARVQDAAVARAATLGGPWHLLVLVEDWCGDAVNTLPAIARLTEQVPGIDLRTLGRDTNLDLMDAHLTNGTSRSIPVVMILDATYRERAWWGPRPAALQAWVMGEGRTMTKEDRYREVRRWYARDHGATTIDEILGLIAAAPAATGAPLRVSPVEGSAAAGLAGGPQPGPSQG